MIEKILFGYISLAIIVLSVFVITRKNPVHSVVLMLVLFFHIALLYLTLNAEFLAAIQIIIYAGAVLVLFLFVIFLLNLKEEVIVERFVGPWPLGLSAALAFAIMIFLTTASLMKGQEGSIGAEVIKAETNTKVLGRVLFTQYLFPFEVLSVVLLVAIIGAIVLTKRRLKS
ncbi:MAG: NADH-quinone oxidoreductase subunit J [Thermodesulfovibrionales bacterium]